MFWSAELFREQFTNHYQKMKLEVLTRPFRYTTITNNLRLLQVFYVSGQRLSPSIPSVGLLQACICRSKAIHGVIWDEKPQIERLCACYMLHYGDDCRYLLILQAIVTMYIRMTTKMMLSMVSPSVYCGHILMFTIRFILQTSRQSNFNYN